MHEVGIDLNTAKPQRLTAELAQDAEMLITMGCGNECPTCVAYDVMTGQTRHEIKRRVLRLLAREQLTGSVVPA
jgi:arsenate reductase